MFDGFDVRLANEIVAGNPIVFLTGWRAIADVLALAAFLLRTRRMTGSAETCDVGGWRRDRDVIF